MRFLKYIAVAFCIFTVLPAYAIKDLPFKSGDSLSLQDCVAIAINNSPVIKSYEYNMETAKSNVGIAKSAFFPTLGTNAGIYQDYNSNKNYNGSSNRDLPSVSVMLEQLIWDFGKTSSYIKMEKFYEIAAEYQFMDSICFTIYDVKTKYYAALRAEAIVEIQRNYVRICERNLDRAKKLFESGKKPKIDYINAKVFYTESKMRLLDAENDYENAMADLANSLYIAYAPDFKLVDTDTFRFADTFIPDDLDEFPKNYSGGGFVNAQNTQTSAAPSEQSAFKKLPFTLEASYDLANKNSPDIWVLDATLDAMKQSLLYVKRQYYPSMVGNVGYGFNNSREYSNNNINMSVGMTSSLNVKQLKHEIDRAQAQVDLASNDIALFKQNLYFRVKKAYINVKKHENQIPIAKRKADEALENYEMENDRYDTGESDYIALMTARTNFNDAKVLYVDTLYKYNIALAELEISMHYHLDDLHHQTQHALNYHYKDILNKLHETLHCEHMHEEESAEPKGHKEKL